MSSTHLAVGSHEPPKVNGLVRLYSNAHCPYAQRVRLILKAKGVPHDVVNINLSRRPEWYFKIHPEGKVPALDDGTGKIIIESLDICDYLDDKYQENPLYPQDLVAKKQDKDLIQKIALLTTTFYKCLINKEGKSFDEWLSEFLPDLEVFENELSKRGPFFGGDKPGMIDYMLWPWAERSGIVPIKYMKMTPLQEGQIPNLRNWRDQMLLQSPVSETYVGPGKLWKVVELRLNGKEPNYDL